MRSFFRFEDTDVSKRKLNANTAAAKWGQRTTRPKTERKDKTRGHQKPKAAYTGICS
jgi:hypothetical protein